MFFPTKGVVSLERTTSYVKDSHLSQFKFPALFCFKCLQNKTNKQNVYLSQKRREAGNLKWDKSECFTKSRDGKW